MFCSVHHLRRVRSISIRNSEIFRKPLQYIIRPSIAPQERQAHNKCEKSEESFWSDAKTWKTAGKHTLRCLLGCSLGDFSMMFWLQSAYPSMSMSVTMPLSMAAGIITSVGLETSVLKMTERFTWNQSFRTAMSMSLISMLTMEFVENTAVDYLIISSAGLTFHDPMFWAALGPSMLAGFLAPLPYNYYKLKRYGKSCH
eukprot:45284_1